jgi:rhamnopyranosyl-N-acetylglucosaminyl-diphospho-decaprenol beta-1,3/1,4-galactofuranosyltransferase
MRILAHIHTMNDAAAIEQALEGLRRQTRPSDAILIVDNASADGTLDRPFPETVTIVRNPENLGTSGAVRAGLDHALTLPEPPSQQPNDETKQFAFGR